MCPKKLGHKDARVHYAVLKQQTATASTPATRHPPTPVKQDMIADVTEAGPARGTTAPTTRQRPGAASPTDPMHQRHPTATMPHRRGPFPQDPTVCPNRLEPLDRRSHSHAPKSQAVLAGPSDPAEPSSQCSTNERATRETISLTEHGVDPDTSRGRGQMLLRKEVIQPHLPVRLPCYDFVPIASPTFDRSPQQAGWATGFGCCRLS